MVGVLLLDVDLGRRGRLLRRRDLAPRPERERRPAAVGAEYELIDREARRRGIRRANDMVAGREVDGACCRGPSRRSPSRRGACRRTASRRVARPAFESQAVEGVTRRAGRLEADVRVVDPDLRRRARSRQLRRSGLGEDPGKTQLGDGHREHGGALLPAGLAQEGPQPADRHLHLVGHERGRHRHGHRRGGQLAHPIGDRREGDLARLAVGGRQRELGRNGVAAISHDLQLQLVDGGRRGGAHRHPRLDRVEGAAPRGARVAVHRGPGPGPRVPRHAAGGSQAEATLLGGAEPEGAVEHLVWRVGVEAHRRTDPERTGRRHRNDASHRELLVPTELVAGVGPLAGEQDHVAVVERVGPDFGGQVGRQPEQLLGGHAGNAHLGHAHVERRRRGPHLDLHLLEGPGGEGDDLTGLGQRRLVEVDVDGFAAVEAKARVEHLLARRGHGLQQREFVGRHRFGQRDPEPLAGDGVEPHDPPVGAGVAVDGVGRAILGVYQSG